MAASYKFKTPVKLSTAVHVWCVRNWCQYWTLKGSSYVDSLRLTCKNWRGHLKLNTLQNFLYKIDLSDMKTVLMMVDGKRKSARAWHKWADTWQKQQNDCASSETQITLGICSVWSESSLSTGRKLGSLATHWWHSEDSDQTGRMSRLIWVFAGRTEHFVGFVMLWLKSTKWPVYPERNIISAWASAQSDQSHRVIGNQGSMDQTADAKAGYIICWSHMSLCWFCRAPTQLCS